jgi:hypothetical protein
MQKCCKNSYSICNDFVGCPTGLIIKVPPGYPESDIIIRIFKNDKLAFNVEDSIDEGGFVLIDIEELPNGYINPYGATYTIQFMTYSTGEVYEFMVQGSVYDSIEFNLIQGTTTYTDFTIDIF